jgi:hypothetical protein
MVIKSDFIDTACIKNENKDWYYISDDFIKKIESLERVRKFYIIT